MRPSAAASAALLLLALTPGCRDAEPTTSVHPAAAPATPTVLPRPAVTPPDGFVVVPAGTYRRGASPGERGYQDDEGPVHVVTLTRPFLLAKTEVTVARFGAFVRATDHVTDAERSGWGMGSNGSDRHDGLTWKSPGFEQSDDHPVVVVSWNDAAAYADWRSRTDGLPPCYAAADFDPTCPGWRLPTEAEWEWAARAGTEGLFPGRAADAGDCDEDPALVRIAWYCGSSEGHTHPVGELAASGWGLHDMQGNAWEWVHDPFVEYGPAPLTDPLGGTDLADRTSRGGGWGTRIEDLRVTVRVDDPPDGGFDNLGFRLARTVVPDE
jgi:formylglycine-generating enzyme required for sulfatase activity